MPLVSSSFSLEMLGQLKIFMFNNFKILLLEILSQKQKILPTLEIATRNAKNCTALHHSTIFKNNFFIVRKIATHFFFNYLWKSYTKETYQMGNVRTMYYCLSQERLEFVRQHFRADK